MTERTWALLIICITVIFIAAIIADCIKSVKGIKDKAPITKGVIVGSKEWQEDE